MYVCTVRKHIDMIILCLCLPLGVSGACASPQVEVWLWLPCRTLGAPLGRLRLLWSFCISFKVEYSCPSERTPTGINRASIQLILVIPMGYTN